MNFMVSDGEFTDSQEVLINVNMVDVEVGLSYFGARFYDPETACFLTADTYTNLPNDERILSGWSGYNQILQIGFTDSQQYNQYSYCQNNPINRMDPDGHFAITLGIAITITISPAAVIAAKTVFAAAVGALIGKAIVESRTKEDTYAQPIPNIKGQGRENTEKKKTKDWVPKSGKRDPDRPRKPHTPGRDHRKYKPTFNEDASGDDGTTGTNSEGNSADTC